LSITTQFESTESLLRVSLLIGSHFVHQEKNKRIINSTSFKIRVIPNSVESLQLHKQCERWAWSCDDYFDQIVEATATTKLRLASKGKNRERGSN